MKTAHVLLGLLVIMLLFALTACSTDSNNTEPPANNRSGMIKLPPPILESECSLEETIYSRVSRRSFSGEALTLQQIAQLLWAAQGKGVDGVTGASRTAPSAGATHPIEIYLAVGNVESIEPGLYRYHFAEHNLEILSDNDIRADLARAALNQQCIADAPVSIILAAEYQRTTLRYGDRGIRYVHMEIGHITQNIYLQCESLGLGTVAIGAFTDQDVKSLLGVAEEPLMIMPVGKPANR